jgi:hypothetical protein
MATQPQAPGSVKNRSRCRRHDGLATPKLRFEPRCRLVHGRDLAAGRAPVRCVVCFSNTRLLLFEVSNL